MHLIAPEKGSSSSEVDPLFIPPLDHRTRLESRISESGRRRYRKRKMIGFRHRRDSCRSSGITSSRGDPIIYGSSRLRSPGKAHSGLGAMAKQCSPLSATRLKRSPERVFPGACSSCSRSLTQSMKRERTVRLFLQSIIDRMQNDCGTTNMYSGSGSAAARYQPRCLEHRGKETQTRINTGRTTEMLEELEFQEAAKGADHWHHVRITATL